LFNSWSIQVLAQLSDQVIVSQVLLSDGVVWHSCSGIKPPKAAVAALGF
jgi:hypothetical protein